MNKKKIMKIHFRLSKYLNKESKIKNEFSICIENITNTKTYRNILLYKRNFGLLYNYCLFDENLII